jgi:hypothetical protein
LETVFIRIYFVTYNGRFVFPLMNMLPDQFCGAAFGQRVSVVRRAHNARHWVKTAVEGTARQRPATPHAERRDSPRRQQQHLNGLRLALPLNSRETVRDDEAARCDRRSFYT